ncbi:MAG: hypothetical protein IRY94_18740 [Rhodospirillaceae bacterium]|nr:hypothetical protein [Rhodospirillaceae bacterium]
MKSAPLASLGAALAVLLAVAPAARAQTGPLNPEETRQCLCRSQQLDRWRRENELQLEMIDERKAELFKLSRQIDATRPLVDPNDLAAVEAFKRMLMREQALRNYVQDELRGSYADRIKRYNAAVEEYNAHCTRRPMLKVNVDALQGKLQCPDFP